MAATIKSSTITATKKCKRAQIGALQQSIRKAVHARVPIRVIEQADAVGAVYWLETVLAMNKADVLRQAGTLWPARRCQCCNSWALGRVLTW